MASPSGLKLAQYVLPLSAQAYERASFAALAEVMPIDHSAASTIWNPWTCPAHLLPILAYSLSVDLWNDDWPETKKRSVIAASPELHDLKTSLEGYRRHLAIADCTLVDWIAPPRGFVFAPSRTEDERRAWLRSLPELRLYAGSAPEPYDGGFVFGLSYFQTAAYLPDRGRAMRARKAKLYDPVTDTETLIGPVDYDRIEDGETAISYERVALPGPHDPSAIAFGLTSFEQGYFIPPNPAAAPVFTWRVDTVGRQTAFSPLDALPYGYGVVDVASMRVPLRRKTELEFFFGADFYGTAFYGEEKAGLGFYDVFKIAKVGERSGTPLVEAGGYYGLDRFGWPTHTLHLLIRADAPFDPSGFHHDVSFYGASHIIPDDLRWFDQALRAAYVASGPGSDHVTLSTETTRFLALSDGIPLDGSFFFGKRVSRARA